MTAPAPDARAEAGPDILADPLTEPLTEPRTAAGPHGHGDPAAHDHTGAHDHTDEADDEGFETPWSGLQDYQCFGCSPHNDQGLQLRFRTTPDGISTTFRLGNAHESYPGVVHGGLAGVITDETMGNLIVLRTGLPAFTTALRLRYLAPIAVGAEHECRARIITGSETSGLISADAEILDAAGNLVATAKATYRPLALDQALDRFTLSAGDSARLATALATSAREES